MARNDSRGVAGAFFLVRRSFGGPRRKRLKGLRKGCTESLSECVDCPWRGRLLQRPPNRGLADLVLARQFRHRLASSVPLGNAPALAGIECSRSAELLAVGLGPLDAFLTTLADQAALKLGNTAHDGEH